MLARAFTRTLWNAYDALGRLLVANLLWLLMTLPWIGLLYLTSLPFRPPFSSLLVSGLLPIFFLNPAAAGLAEMTQRLAETGETDLTTFFRGIRAHAVRSTLLMCVGVLVVFALVSSLYFYSTGEFAALSRVVNVGLSGVTVWVALILGAVGCYWLPVAVGVPGREPRVFFILKRAGLLSLDNIGFTAGVFLVTALASAFWIVTGVGIFFCWMSFVRLFQAHARRALNEKYDAADALRHRGIVPTRETLRVELSQRWEREPKRALRELLKPWDNNAND